MPATETAATTTDPPKLPVGWRFRVGIVLFALSFVPWGPLLPAVFYMLPAKTLATLAATGLIFHKVVLVGAVMLLGKAGFAFLKAALFRKLTPPAEVGPMRYRIGLVMLCLPLLQGLLETYASHIAPRLAANRLWVDVLMDAMLIASVFVLGGNFWDKLRALFVAEARAVFPKDSNTTAVTPFAR